MHQTRTLVLLLYLFFCSSAAFAEITEGGTGLAYGEDHAYFLTAPAGWMLDTESGVEQHLFAVFYPKGSSWDAGAVVMYSNASALKGRTSEQAIQDDFNELAQKSAKLKMEDAGTITTKDNKQAIVKYFKGDNWGNVEATAYVVEPKTVANIVLTARNKEAFEKSLPAFRQLVGSYRFITDAPGSVDLRALVRAEHDKEMKEKDKQGKDQSDK